MADKGFDYEFIRDKRGRITRDVFSDPEVLMSQLQIKTSCDGASKLRDEKVFTFCQNDQCCSTSPLLFLNNNCKEKNYYQPTEIGECAQFKFGFAKDWYKITGNVTYTGFPSHMDIKLSFKDGSRYDMVCSLFDGKKLDGNVTNGPKFLNLACKDICVKDDFSCGNGNCVGNWAKCNGYDNCGDQSDEEGCTATCKSSEFDCLEAGCTNPDNEKCRDTCIPKSWVNNGKEECADGSDEGTIVECDAPRHCCKNGNQGCEGKCIPDQWINDGEEDCDDGSDEKGKNCDGVNYDSGCCSIDAPCAINEGDCDSESECQGNLICGQSNCPAPFHSGADCCESPFGKNCDGVNYDGECCSVAAPCAINEGDCDIDSDCQGNLTCGSNNCPAPFPSDADCCESSSGKVVCSSSEFDCKVAGCMNPDDEECRGTCIPKNWVNDGDEECADGSDEGAIVTCDAPHHCCQNGDQGCEGKCIPDQWINDGDEDCDDGSDEKDGSGDSDGSGDTDGFGDSFGSGDLDGSGDSGGTDEFEDPQTEYGDDEYGDIYYDNEEYNVTYTYEYASEDSADPLTNSEEDSSGEVEVEKSTRNRVERVHDIKESKRKKKRASDIIEDSEDICDKDDFTCTNGNCIQSSWKCDGQDDCGSGDLSDEENCPDTDFKVGDLVILSDNEYLAKSEFDLLSDFQWVDQMRFMLGEKFPIVAIFDPKTVVLPSPDGSQDWYFPKSLVTKVSDTTNDIVCQTGYYHCKESRKCISDEYLCDGRVQCWSLDFVEVTQGTDGVVEYAVMNTGGDDEDLELCKSRKAFPKEASFDCNEANRPEKSPIKILAIPCNLVPECENNEHGVAKDEWYCDISLIVLIILLASGFFIICLAACLIVCCQKNKDIGYMIEIKEFDNQEDNFEKVHQTEDCGLFLALKQGKKNRKLDNQAWMASELDHHGTYAKALACLKNTVDPITFKTMLDDQVEESKLKKYLKKSMKKMKKKIKSSKKDKEKKKKTRMYQDIMTQIEIQSRMTFPNFGECIGVVFLFYQDLIKDTFLLSKMVISVGGSAYAFNLTTFASLVVVCTLLTILVPTYLTGLQIAIEGPGLVLGKKDVPSGYKRKLLQLALVVCSPITVLALKMQYQLALQKWKRLQKIENQDVINEFRELNFLLHQLDVQHSKAMKVDLTFEIFHQIAITIVLLMFSTSQTKTTSAMEAIFVPKGNFILGININGYFIFTASMLIGLVSFMLRSARGNYRSLKCTLAFGIYGFINLTMRLLAIIDFSVPPLGMLDVLRHLQADRIPFANPKVSKGYSYTLRGYEEIFQHKYNFTSDTLYYGNAEPISWSDISHVNYTNPEFTTPPPYTIYTGMNSQTAFIIFFSLWLIQIICIWVKNLCKSESFCELSFLDQFIHAFHCVIMPTPSVDWETGQGDCEEHFRRMKNAQNEVIGTIKINSLFQSLHLMPLLYLAYTVTQRQWLLEKSIGTMQIEDKAFETIWITILFSLIVFIVGPILSCFVFKKANGLLHPCFGIIAEEVKKEEQKSKRTCCGILSLFLKFRHAQALSEH